MQNGRYIPLEIRHLLEDGARRRGTSYERELYLYETSELEQLVDAAAAENAKRAAAEKVLEDFARAEAAAKADAVADHLEKMFAAAYFARSNSKKSGLYHILQGAVEAVALLAEDDSPAERLARRIARAEHYLFDEPNATLFKDAIVRAFEVSKFRDFTRLAEEIRKAEDAENLRRLAFRLIGPSRKVVLDREAERLMNVRIPPKRTQKMGNPISRSEVSAALQAVRRRKSR